MITLALIVLGLVFLLAALTIFSVKMIGWSLLIGLTCVVIAALLIIM